MRTYLGAGLLALAVVAGHPADVRSNDTTAEYDSVQGASVDSEAVSATGESNYFQASGCGGECGCCDDGRLFGVIARSDRCFSDFISPMTNPVFFEDPRTLTEARVIFLNHKTPPALGADNVQLAAMQLRAALTDRLSFIATKDGFIFSQSPLLDDGWADVAAGLKYNLIHDCCSQTILSAGATYEIPIGSTRALQGNGAGEFNLFLTGGKQLGSCYHVVSAAGFRLPADDTAENQVFYWSGHLDRKIGCDWYAFVETNWYHYLKSGNAFQLPVEGGDLFNLGSVGVAGNDLVTGAFGFKRQLRDIDEIGVAWEFPLTDRRGLLDNRLTVDYIIRY
ncbi:MAG: hypothetical protein WD875_17600 [Pirellulales bacterium]